MMYTDTYVGQEDICVGVKKDLIWQSVDDADISRLQNFNQQMNMG